MVPTTRDNLTNLELLQLPHEVLKYILSFITEISDYSNIRLVSRAFRDIVNEKSLWVRDNLCITRFDGFGLSWTKKVSERKQLKQAFIFGHQGLRVYILYKEHLAKLLHEEIYGSVLLKDRSMTLYFYPILDLCDFKTVKSIESRELDELIKKFICVQKKVVEGSADVLQRIDLERFSICYIKLRYNEHAIFILKHPYLRNKLMQKQLLDLACIHPDVAKIVVREDHPALVDSISEIFFKILAASLTHQDYPLPGFSNGVISKWMQYLKHKYFLSESIQSRLRNDPRLLSTLINEARKDGRLAVLLLVPLSFSYLLSSKSIIELFLNDVQAKEKHWVRQYCINHDSNTPNLKYPVENPTILWSLSGLARFILFDVNLSQRVLPKIKTVSQVDKSQVIPHTIQEWEGFSLYPTHFELHDGTQFTLYLNQEQYQSIYAKLHPVLQQPSCDTVKINLSGSESLKPKTFVKSYGTSGDTAGLLVSSNKSWYHLVDFSSLMLIFCTLLLLGTGVFCLALVPVYPLGAVTLKLLAGTSFFCGVIMGMMTYSALKMDFSASNELSSMGSTASYVCLSQNKPADESPRSGKYNGVVTTVSLTSPLPQSRTSSMGNVSVTQSRDISLLRKTFL